MAEPAYLTDTRSGYDAIAEAYADTFRAELRDSPLDRALLAAFAELVGQHPDAHALEVGSGPGQVTAHLHGLGLNVRGIDLSPAMVALARRTYPGIAFDVGEMGSLDVPDAGLAGLVAWYSVIHIAPEALPGVFAEFRRVLRPGGHLLLAFQVGDDVLHVDEAFGHEVRLDFRRLRPERIKVVLADAGFALTAEIVRAPQATSAARHVPQGFLLAQKV